MTSQASIIQLGRDDVVSRNPEQWMTQSQWNDLKIRRKINELSVSNHAEQIRLLNTKNLNPNFSETISGYTRSSENSRLAAFLIPKHLGGCTIFLIDKEISDQNQDHWEVDEKIEVPSEQKCLDLKLISYYLLYLTADFKRKVLTVCKIRIDGLQEDKNCETIFFQGFLKEELTKVFPKFIEGTIHETRIPFCIYFDDKTSVYRNRMIYCSIENKSYWFDIGSNNLRIVQIIFMNDWSEQSLKFYILTETAEGGAIHRAEIDLEILKSNVSTLVQFDKEFAHNIIALQFFEGILVSVFEKNRDVSEFILDVKDDELDLVKIKLAAKPERIKILINDSLCVAVHVTFEAKNQPNTLYIFDKETGHVMSSHFNIKNKSMGYTRIKSFGFYVLILIDLEAMNLTTFELNLFSRIFYDRNSEILKETPRMEVWMAKRDDVSEITNFEFLDANELKIDSNSLKNDQESNYVKIPVRGNNLAFGTSIHYFKKLSLLPHSYKIKFRPVMIAMFQNFIAFISKSNELVIGRLIIRNHSSFEIQKISSFHPIVNDVSQITSVIILPSKQVAILVDNKVVILFDFNTYHNGGLQGKNQQQISALPHCRTILKIYQGYIVCEQTEFFTVHSISYNFENRSFEKTESKETAQNRLSFEIINCLFFSSTFEYTYYTIKRDESDSVVRWYLRNEGSGGEKFYLIPDIKSKSIVDLRQVGEFLLFVTKENNQFGFFARISSFFIFFPKSEMLDRNFKKLISIETIVEANAFVVIYQTVMDSIRASVYRVELDPYSRLHTDLEIQIDECQSTLTAISMADFRTLQFFYICKSDSDSNTDQNFKIWNFILESPAHFLDFIETSETEFEINKHKYTFHNPIKTLIRELEIPSSVNLDVKSYLRDVNEKYNIYDAVLDQFSGPIRRISLTSNNLPVKFFDTISQTKSVFVTSHKDKEDFIWAKILIHNEIAYILDENSLMLKDKRKVIAESGICHEVQILNNSEKISKKFKLPFLCKDAKSHLYSLQALGGEALQTLIGGNSSFEFEAAFLGLFELKFYLFVKFKRTSLLYSATIESRTDKDSLYVKDKKGIINLNKYDDPKFTIKMLTLIFQQESSLLFIVLNVNDELNLKIVKYKITNFYFKAVEEIRVPFPLNVLSNEMNKILFLKEDNALVVYFYTEKTIFRAKLVSIGSNLILEADDIYENNTDCLFCHSKIENAGDFVAILNGPLNENRNQEIHIYNRLQKSTVKSVFAILDLSKARPDGYFIIDFKLQQKKTGCVDLFVLYSSTDTPKQIFNMHLTTFEIQNISVSISSLEERIDMHLSFVDYQNGLHETIVTITPIHFAITFGMLCIAALVVVLAALSFGVCYFIYKESLATGRPLLLENSTEGNTEQQTSP
jgi:hypothetical protein